MKIVIVSPAKNEELHIEQLMKELLKFKLEVVLVDDGSVDRTGIIASEFTPYVLRHCINLGKGSSLKTGCDFAFDFLKADAVILLDSDGQHSPAEIPLFCKELQRGNNLVLGVRNFQTKMPLYRNIMNTFLTQFMRAIYSTKIPDIPSGYKAFTKKNYRLIAWDGSGYEVELQIAINIARLKLQFSCVSIQTIYHNYDRGMTMLDVSSAFFKIIFSKLYQIR